jgi:hypothetical protein
MCPHTAIYVYFLEKVFLSSYTLPLSSQQWTVLFFFLQTQKFKKKTCIYIYVLYKLALEEVFLSSHTLPLSSQQWTDLTKINLYMYISLNLSLIY